jgi:rare lipoprotein A
MFRARIASAAAKNGPAEHVGAVARDGLGAIRSQQMNTSLCVAVAAAVALSGCAGKKKRPAAAVPAPIGSTESGLASWYGHPYHGRRAANGEIYDMEKMTAAHRTLPFGAWVEVRNLTNSKTTQVRITDRGPFIDGRIIDLSRAAASAIDMIGPGVVQVRLTVIRPPANALTASYGVQVGAFTDRANAERLEAEMKKRYGASRIVGRDSQPPQWRVVVGVESEEASAAALAERIRKDTGQAPEAFVVRLDD